MSSSTEEIEARSINDVVAVPKTSMLNIDVLIMILQHVIDEEAGLYLEEYRLPPTVPKAAVTFALVCKRWKDVVYSTASFWPIIQLSMDSASDEMQAKLNLAINRARNTPVNLHIFNVHSHLYDPYRVPTSHNNDCCCRRGSTRIHLDFTGLSNVRCFRLHFRPGAESSLLDPSTLTFINHVKMMDLLVLRSDRELPRSLDLSNLLCYAPNIVELRLNRVEVHNLSWPLSNKALMRKLRTLSVGTGLTYSIDGLISLAQLLSHAPNLEELIMPLFDYRSRILIPLPRRFLESVNCFPKLRTVRAQCFALLNWLFTDEGVQIPNLQEVRYNELIINEGFHEINEFFSAHWSIKEVIVETGDGPIVYGRGLYSASNIEELTIHMTGQSAQCLAPLYTAVPDGDTAVASYICPNLRILSVTDSKNSISPISFDKFVRVRCQPVTKEGYTVAECKAIEVLRLELPTFTNKYESPSATKAQIQGLRWKLSGSAYKPEYLSTTEAWKRAKVRKISENKYELQWAYHPE